MHPIFDIIRAQVAAKSAFTRNQNHNVLDRSQFQKFHWELYPLMQDYYHELNPFFVANLYKKELFQFSNLITVRDGKIPFANFLVNNVDNLNGTETHFLIPKSFSSLIPATFKDRFSCWSLSQDKKLPIEKAKRVIIFGMLIDKYIGPLEELKNRVKDDLAKIDPKAKIELLLTQRHDPFSSVHRENLLHFQVFDRIRSLFPEREITLLKLERFLDRSYTPDDYFYDLKYDDVFVADNYLHYYFASRGVTVNLLPEAPPKETLTSLRLSFWHTLHVGPFEFVSNDKFSEMLFHKRLQSKHLLQDKTFHKIVTSE